MRGFYLYISILKPPTTNTGQHSGVLTVFPDYWLQLFDPPVESSPSEHSLL